MGIQGGYSYWGFETSGGGTPGLTLIESKVLSVATADVEFTSIPQTYAHLILKCSLRTTGAGSVNTGELLRIEINGDSAVGNYAYALWRGGNGWGIGSTVANDVNQVILAPTQNAPSDFFSVGDITFNDYRGSHYKISQVVSSAYIDTAYPSPGSPPDWRLDQNSLMWESTAAITSILIKSVNSNNLASGCRLDLYGVI